MKVEFERLHIRNDGSEVFVFRSGDLTICSEVCRDGGVMWDGVHEAVKLRS